MQLPRETKSEAGEQLGSGHWWPGGRWGLGAHRSWGGQSHGSGTPSTGIRIQHRALRPAPRPWVAAHPHLSFRVQGSRHLSVCRAPATCWPAPSECGHCSLETGHRQTNEQGPARRVACQRVREQGMGPVQGHVAGQGSQSQTPALPLLGDQASWAKMREGADLVWSGSGGWGGRRGGIPGPGPRAFHT